MYKDVTINWEVFQYKFTGNSRDVFEHLAYILFCYEFKIETGIFRYFNQPYVETLPIDIGDECIGFQAKYYDASTSISDKKLELKNAIDGAKTKYSNINKFIIYTNKELSTSSKKDTVKPEYQIEIEKHGLEKDISVEWRVKSNFEIMLMMPELELVRDYFFNPDLGIKGYVAQVKLHSQNKLENIKSTISYRDQIIKINKNNFNILSFHSSENSSLIIYGDGGSGKSAFVKDLLESESATVIAFKATDFDMATFAEFSRSFGEYSFEDYLKLFKNEERKICLIDSMEKVLIMNNQDTIKTFINLLIKYEWKIIFTIRTIHKDNFVNNFLYGVKYQELKIDTLSKQELQEALTGTDIILPKESSYINLLGNLFYLKLYIELACKNTAEISTIEKFVESIWNHKIKSANQNSELDIRREKTICHIVLSCANEGVYYYSYQCHDDSKAIALLKEDEIIAYDETMRGYYLSHDIYEEIVLKHIFEDLYIKKIDCRHFFKDIGNSLVVRKIFRLWIKEKLSQEAIDIKDFILEVFYSDEISSIWKDEILITLMGIEDETNSLNLIKQILTKDKHKLLFRAIFLLNTTCRIIDGDFWNKILTAEEQKKTNLYRKTKPTGTGWTYVLNLIYEDLDIIKWNPQNIMTVIECLNNWTFYNIKGTETKHAGLTALFLYKKIKTDEKLKYKLNDETVKEIITVILSSAFEIDNELSTIIEEVIRDESFNHMHEYYDLCLQAVSNVYDCGNLVDSNPKLVFDLANKYWFLKKERAYYRTYGTEDAFGINDSTSHDYYPSSSFQTPIFRLLQSHPWETLDFIIELFDKVTIKYKNSYLGEKYNEIKSIKVIFPSGKEVEQIASERLWSMYRGTSTAPNLLECILMALERWLLFVFKETPEVSERISLKLLNSQSVALTSVIVSLIEAYPQNLFYIACILIPTKEIFILDNSRAINELSSNFLKGLIPTDKLFDDERIKTNNQEFRKKRFEDVIIEYQLNSENVSEVVLEKRNNLIYKQFDKVFETINEFEELYQFPYYRMDIRRLKPDIDNLIMENGTTYVPLVSQLPAPLIEFHNESNDQKRELLNESNLYLWAVSRFKHEFNKSEKYTDYENNPLKALREAKEIWHANNKAYSYLPKYTPIYVFTILIRDFKESILEEDYSYCRDGILKYIEDNIGRINIAQVGSECEAAVSTLPLIMANENEDEISFDKAIELLLSLILDTNKLAIDSFSIKAWELDYKRALGLFNCYVELKPQYDTEVGIYNGITTIEFIKKNRHKINMILANQHTLPNDFSKLDYNTLLKLNILLSPINKNTLTTSIEIGKAIWGILFKDNHRRSRDFERNVKIEMNYIKWLSQFLMNISLEEQRKFLTVMAEYISCCESLERFLRDIILMQDKLHKYNEFWHIWNRMQPIIISLCKKTEERDRTISSREYHDGLDKIVETYLLAFPWWNDNIRSWHSLKKENHLFFRHISHEIGHNASVLYAIGRVLNTIGYDFLSQGIDWLYEIIKNNPHLEHKKLELNTEYYLKEYMQRYILENRLYFKRNPSLRNKVITILNFLVNRGSTCSYMLRESIV